MRKNLLFFILFTFGIALNAQQEVKEIKGASTAASGKTFTFKVIFDKALTSTTQFIVTTPSGTFDNGTNTFKEFISTGKTEIELKLRWNDNLNGDYVISAYRAGSYVKKELKVRVQPSSFYIEGPEELNYNEEKTYSFVSNLTHTDWKAEKDNRLQITDNSRLNNLRMKLIQQVNEPVILNEGLTVKITTSSGEFTATKKLVLKPTVAITTNNSTVCIGGPMTYSIPNLPYNASVTWTGKSCISGTKQGHSVTFYAENKGTATVEASIIYANGYVINLQNSSITVGQVELEPGVPLVESVKGYCWHSSTHLQSKIKNATSYIWKYQNKTIELPAPYGGNIMISASDLAGFSNCALRNSLEVSVTGQSPCGSITRKFNISFQDYSDYDAWCYNKNNPGGPQKPERSIQVPSEEISIYDIKVYNLSGSLVYSITKTSDFDISTTSLDNGVYIIEKFDGINRTIEKVLLNK